MKKNIRVFQTQSEYDTFISGDDVLRPNVSYVRGENEVHYNPKPDYSKQYLTFEALESGTFKFGKTIDYSLDNGTTWTTLEANTASPTVVQGDKILWRGQISSYGTFSSTANYNVEGNIMSLLYGDNFANQTELPNGSYTFYSLFYGNTRLISAVNMVLPATTLRDKCYNEMFKGCTSLTTAPNELPATTLAVDCYNSMFNGCTALTTAPTLPATTLASQCYYYMFVGCTSLTTAPELPATTLAVYCYSNMFANCKSLTTAPELPATTLAQYCYQYMFAGCTNLNNITMLATTISNGSLNTWVNNVAATGTFTKAAEMTTLPTGASGIPSGWTVVDA